MLSTFNSDGGGGLRDIGVFAKVGGSCGYAATPKQQAILNMIFAPYDARGDESRRQKPNIIISGPGGAGKTTLLKMIKAGCEDRHIEFGLTALTGVAAYNLGGETLHRFSGIGVGKGHAMELIKKVSENFEVKMKLRRLQMLIIDEISMMGLELFEKLDKVYGSIRNRSLQPYGGVQLILCGDFLQLPPVNDQWFFNSESYDRFEFKVHIMEEPLRYTDKPYFDMLMRVRDGRPTQDDHAFLLSRVEAYKNEIKGKDLKIRPTIFYSCNKDVDMINECELRKLGGEMFTFVAMDIFDPKIKSSKLSHYVGVCETLAPEIVNYKVGSQVMLKTNIDPAEGFCNGSRGVILDICKDTETVKVQFLNGKTLLIGRNVWEYKDADGNVSRSQIPLVLAWSMTIHKSQSCTLDFAVGDLGPSVFAPGQAYVMLSRIRNRTGLFLMNYSPKSIKVDNEALEYVKQFRGEVTRTENAQPVVDNIKLVVDNLMPKWDASVYTDRVISFDTKKLTYNGIEMEFVEDESIDDDSGRLEDEVYGVY